MERMEQSGLCWGDYRVMSGVECCGFYDTKYLWKTRGLLLSSSSMIQGVQNNLQPLIQLKVPLAIGLS